SHAGLANLVAWHIDTYAMTAEDRSTLLAGTGFDASVWEVWPTLCAGASLHVPDLGVRASPAELPRWLADRGVTLCFVPTPLGETLLDEEWPDAMALRVLLVGGSTLHRHRPVGFAAQLVNHYGPTENSVVATFHEVAPAAPDGVAQGAAPPIGRPVDGCRAYVLDQRGDLVPRGVVGELCLGGDSLALGYLGRPAWTAASFVPDPFASTPGARLYRTGDLARHRADGAIEFRGRRDAQVKVRGFRIELGEIESVLLESPAVREAIVESRRQPSGETILVAWVALSEPVSPAELRGPLGDVLPDYMVPTRFLELDELPKTANGKIDRAALAALDDRQDDVEVVKVLPRTPLERTVAKVYASVLQIDGFGIDDSFFELGGSSLLLTRAQRRLADELERDVPIIELFNHPTVRLLAEHLGDRVDAPRAGDQAAARTTRSRDRLRLQRARRAERG
ncbi:MAG: non-ribosomal peptide synthetase, partial [Acidobacteriota bacterium]